MPTVEISDETWDKIKDQVLAEGGKEIQSLDDLVGQKVLFECARYHFYGKVKKVTPELIELTEAGKVFESGELKAKSPTDLQEFPGSVFIFRAAVECFWKPKW